MTVEPVIVRGHAEPVGRRGWRTAWRDLADQFRSLDVLMAATAAALPWSTSLPAVFIVFWLIILIPTLDRDAFVGSLAQPACYLPLVFFALAVIGVFWSEGTWAASLHGIKPVAKLLAIPFLLYHFQRSARGPWVFTAFLASCTRLMILSWIVRFAPEYKIAPTVSDGVPVKNYIDQSQESALCAFALALPILTAFRGRRLLSAAGYLVLLLGFSANMTFVASARTTLVYIPVLLVLFAVLYLGRRGKLGLFAGATAAAILVGSTSPYLQKRVADIAIEYRAYGDNQAASTAQRLYYWRKSIKFFTHAPLFGHGSGAKALFEREAAGQIGLSAEVVSNPHNQTLNVLVQWGLVGGIVLYAMWFSHLLLFRGRNLAAWIGLVVVIQNVVSSLLNSHLFDFHEGWMYVLGVGIAGGICLKGSRTEASGFGRTGADIAANFRSARALFQISARPRR